MKLILLFTVLISSLNTFCQQEIEYQIKIQNFEELDYKRTLGEISNLFAPCSTTHKSDGTLIFRTKAAADTAIIKNGIVNLGYAILEFDIIYSDGNHPPSYTSSIKALNQDCDNATQVCSNATFAGNSDGIGSQELDLTNRGCLIDDERQSSWYYLYVGVSGTLGMTITPTNGDDDYDFAIWGPFTPSNLMSNCPPTSPPIRCNFTSYPDYFPSTAFSCGTLTNPTGMQINAALPTDSDACTDEPYSRHLDVIDGEIYIMIIDNWSTSTDPFDITWNGTGELDCAPIPLGSELADFNVTSINRRQNNISWTTSSEQNNDYFEIQRRDEFGDWKSIKTVLGAGSSTSPLHYSSIDESFSPIKNYYRLKQTDYDGTSSYHLIKMIDNSLDKLKILSCTNVMGQNVSLDSNCLKIITYENGTKLKIFGIVNQEE